MKKRASERGGESLSGLEGGGERDIRERMRRERIIGDVLEYNEDYSHPYIWYELSYQYLSFYHLIHHFIRAFIYSCNN